MSTGENHHVTEARIRHEHGNELAHVHFTLLNSEQTEDMDVVCIRHEHDKHHQLRMSPPDSKIMYTPPENDKVYQCSMYCTDVIQNQQHKHERNSSFCQAKEGFGAPVTVSKISGNGMFEQDTELNSIMQAEFVSHHDSSSIMCINPPDLQQTSFNIDESSTMCCCCICYEKFEEKDALEKHMKESHSSHLTPENNHSPSFDGDPTYENENQGGDDVDQNEMEIHKDAEEETSVSLRLEYKCKVCGEEHQSCSHLLRHIRRVHGCMSEEEIKLREMTCRFCPKTYSNQMSLIRHEARHPDGTASIQCVKCGEVFENHLVLKNHKRHKEPVSCEYCKKVFPNGECLACHMRISHTSEDENSAHGSCSAPNSSPLEIIPSSAQPSVEIDCDPVRVKQRSQCRFCSKKYSHKKSLLRHELSHPNGTAAIKCNLCEEVLENYKALKIHRKQQDERVICSVCNRLFPNLSCLSCHSRNSHSTFDDSAIGDEDDCAESDSYDRKYGFSDDETNTVLKYSQPTYSVCDTSPSPSVLIKIKKARIGDGNSEVQEFTVSSRLNSEGRDAELTSQYCDSKEMHTTVHSPTSVNDSFLQNSGADEEETDEDEEPDYVPEGKTEEDEEPDYIPEGETDKDEQPDYIPEGETDKDEELDYNPEGEMDNDEEPDYIPEEETDKDEEPDYIPEVDTDKDEEPDYIPSPQSADSSSDVSDEYVVGFSGKKKKSKRTPSRRKPGRRKLSSDAFANQSESENSADESVDLHFSRYVVRESNLPIDEESDDDPDWRKTKSSPASKKKTSRSRGRGRRKKYEYTRYVYPYEEKVKRPRAKGCGGKKAQDAAAALAEAVLEMESSTPELKVVIRPLKRGHGGAIMKASVKRYSDILDSDRDYIFDEKKEESVTEKSLEQSEQAENDSTSVQTAFMSSGLLEGENSVTFKTEPAEEDEVVDADRDNDGADDGGEEGGEEGDEEGGEDEEDRYRNEENFTGSSLTKDNEDLTSDSIRTEFSNSVDGSRSKDTDNSVDESILSGSDIDLKHGKSRRPPKKYDLAHIEEANSRKEIRYICKICGRELQYRSHLLRHLRRVHGGEGVDEVMRRLMKCRFCSKQYSNELSLVHHEKLHDGTNKIKCGKCNELFDDKNALRRHQRKMHWEHQPVSCEVCQKQLADSTCLRAHMKHMHTAEERKATIFTCEVCGKQLHTKTAFQNHVASKCGTDLLFPCETCGKSFSFKGSLKAHQLLHTGVRSFLCRFCGKSFHQKGEMKRHERKHTGEKPFVCNECGRAFAYRESLLGHSAVHTGIKPFPCKNCGMRFSCSGNLVKHRRSNNCKDPLQGEPVNAVNSLIPVDLDNQSTSVITASQVNQSGSVNSAVSVGQTNHVNSASLVIQSNILNAGNSVNSLTSDDCPLSVNLGQDNSKINNISSPAPSIPVGGSIISSNLANSLLIARSHNESDKIKVDPQSEITSEQGKSLAMGLDYHISAPLMTSVIKNTPVIGLKSGSVPLTKQMRTKQHVDESHSLPINAGNNRFSAHMNAVFENQDSSMSTRSSYSPHSHVNNCNDNHHRQLNHTVSSERHFSQFSTDVRMGRTDQILDRQMTARRDLSRQMIDVVDRQASRLLDCFAGVQLTNHDGRNSIQGFPGAAHSANYSNIHAGPFNYTAAHSGSHSNVYIANPLVSNQVNFNTFHPGNHLSMNPNNQLPAHAGTHPGSYALTHMSTFGALFGHLGQPSVHSSNFPTGRFSTVPSMCPTSSPPTGNN